MIVFVCMTLKSGRFGKSEKFPCLIVLFVGQSEGLFFFHICFNFSGLLGFCKHYNQSVRDQEMKKEMINNFTKPSVN